MGNILETVVGRTGRPIHKVRVTVYRHVGQGKWKAVEIGYTDTHGRFASKNEYEQGRYCLEFFYPGAFKHQKMVTVARMASGELKKSRPTKMMPGTSEKLSKQWM